MVSNSEIFLIVGALLAFLLVLYAFFKPFFGRKLIQTTIQDSESMLFNGNAEQGTLSFDSADQESTDQELIILNLISMDKSIFDIDQVLMLLMQSMLMDFLVIEMRAAQKFLELQVELILAF